MTKTPTLMEMLKAGVHFGHKKSKRYPKMEPYIYTTRAGINVIDLNKTLEKLEETLKAVKKLSSEGKVLLFVGTKKQAQKIIKKYALECGMPYVINRWVGGAFTNFSVFRKNIKKYLDLQDKMNKGDLDKYTKKERIGFKREIERLESIVGGLSMMDKLPDAIFVVDTKKDKIAIKEANRLKIPVISICDTNSNPVDIKWVIPANDDAVKSIELITGLIAEAVKEGREEKGNNNPAVSK
ncbi:MAG: 30S ribosomal protein S2 [bacterium]